MSRFSPATAVGNGLDRDIAASTAAHAYGAGALTCLAVIGGHAHTAWASIDVDMPPNIFYRKEVAADLDPEAARCMRSSRTVGCGFSAKAVFSLHACAAHHGSALLGRDGEDVFEGCIARGTADRLTLWTTQ